MRVTGVNRLTHRVFFKDESSRASWHILCTKETGSTGSRVLKNSTFGETLLGQGIFYSKVAVAKGLTTWSVNLHS